MRTPAILLVLSHSEPSSVRAELALAELAIVTRRQLYFPVTVTLSEVCNFCFLDQNTESQRDYEIYSGSEELKLESNRDLCLEVFFSLGQA